MCATLNTMDEASHSDEELLALLQPLSMPVDFDFESNLPMKDASDDDGDGDPPLPGPTPPAPMASMVMGIAAPTAPMDKTDSQLQNGQGSASYDPLAGAANGFISSQPEPPLNSQMEEDEDEIAYEPVKTPSRPSRSAKPKTSATRPSSRHKPPSSRPKSKRWKPSTEPEANTEEQPELEEPEQMAEPKSKSLKPESPKRKSPKPETPKAPPSLDFEIIISPVQPATRQEYRPIPPGDEIYRVLERIPTGVPGETWLSVEFEDGHIDQVAFDQFSSYPNGQQALADYNRPRDMGAYPEDDDFAGFSGQIVKRKVTHDPDYDETKGQVDEDEIMRDVLDDDDDDDEDEDMINPAKRRKRLKSMSASDLRRSGRNRDEQRPTYKQPVIFDDDEDDEEDSDFANRRRKGLRKKVAQHLDDDADELGDGPDDLLIVRSDVVPPKKARRGRPALLKRRGRFDDDDDLEEAPRRSGRANQSTKIMYLDDNLEDDMYAPEEEKLPAAPKVSGAKEVFPRVQDGPFKHMHTTNCGTCSLNADAVNKGMMIYCQGCSNAYHKICLGFRTTREHIVTKVGQFQFVLQCRDCVGSKRRKDARTPNLGICQTCKAPGRACAAFASKLPATAEAKLREENGGEDPIHRVDQSLINNPDNILFRCTSCHCAYHFEHLPAIGGKNTEGSVRDDRLDSYSIDWKCKNCLDMQYKISTLVAWRPTDRIKYADQTYLEVPEDAKEYLVKWESRSYAHCEWRSGPWVFGVTNALMRNAFPKRNNAENLYPKFDETDAIPEEYLLADVVLNVTFKNKLHFESKKKDKVKALKVEQALIKFQGLDYSEVVWDEPPNPDSAARWTAFNTAYEEFLNGKHFQSEPLHKIKERLREFRKLDFDKEIAFFAGSKDPPVEAEKPPGLTGDLMKYQVQGMNWLLHNFQQQRSVVLADEMGLGKTIQVIGLITALALGNPKVWPFLVVVPNSTCPNWRREIKKWAPDLRVVTYHGGREPQKLAYQHELFPNGSREMKAHVVIMSYDSAQDPETRTLFKAIQWVGLIVDEGQRLKNDANILYGALTSMKIPWRLLLTGTPLQNNKRELFNLIQFLDSSKNAAQLDEKYEYITAENISELHELIRPYFLRRTKAGPTGVLKFLPPMSQIILPVSMSVVQEKLCKSIMAKKPELIRAIFANTKMKSNERSSLNNILMQLRKCLGHPFLYSGAVEEREVSDEMMHQNLIAASSKLVLLEQMLPKLKERGHRVLIFSQFLGMLDIIEDFLTGIGFMYQRLDGTISSLQKQKRIDAFNEPGSEYFAFLLSTRAGGVGINLATADTVIILDPDFNPHQDMQALSRAHRIGQKHKVLCFQLMTKSSVEEKIMQIGRKKMALDHALIENMDRKEDDAGEDLESILKHGAEALFGENNDKEVIKYDAEAIDKLLDRSQIKNPEYPEGGERTTEKQFAFAQVWENKTGGLANDIQVEESPDLNMSVWDKILKEREAEAQRLAELNKEVLGRGNRRRQAVKYNGNGPAIAGLDEAGDVREGSDIDEDFISNDTSESDDGGASDEMRNLGKVDGQDSDILQGPSQGAGQARDSFKAAETSQVSDRTQEEPPKRRNRRQEPSSAQQPGSPGGQSSAVKQPKPRGRPRKLPLPETASTPAPDASKGKPPNGQQRGDSTYQTIISSSGVGRGVLTGYGYPQGQQSIQSQLNGLYSQQHVNSIPYFGQRDAFGHGFRGVGPFMGAPQGTGPANPQNQFGNAPQGRPPYQQPVMQQVHQMQAQLRQSSNSPVMVEPQLQSNAPRNIPPSPAPHSQCINCRLFHAPTFSCPSLASPVQIYEALDGIKNLSGGDADAKQKNKELLKKFLTDLKNGRQGRGSASAQPQQQISRPQPPQPQISHHPAQQAAQPPKPLPAQQPIQRLAQQLPPKTVQPPRQHQSQPTAAAEESSESESDAESGDSEAESEAGSGSSGSESGEEVLKAILSR